MICLKMEFMQLIQLLRRYHHNYSVREQRLTCLVCLTGTLWIASFATGPLQVLPDVKLAMQPPLGTITVWIASYPTAGLGINLQQSSFSYVPTCKRNNEQPHINVNAKAKINNLYKLSDDTSCTTNKN